MNYIDDPALNDLLTKHVASFNAQDLNQFMSTYHPNTLSLAQIEQATRETFEALRPSVSIREVHSSTSDGSLRFVRLVQRTASNTNPDFRENDVEQVLIVSDFQGEPKILAAAPLRVSFL